ncbi:alpha/beta fold hydrolase [Arthrobacter sp. 35W]|uniref:alpha/beta fold hydrolase n=1 Tax=Arthrobacter sp. 35W TaxID=1132441 RepID=UPI0003F87CB9|nr:alpha/beta hydrolase [Arthrobacter sp. 35W]
MSGERIVFIHGAGAFGAAAWPAQHSLARDYDALFIKRHGFDVSAEPLASDFAADAEIVLGHLDGGAHLVAHAQGAIAAMMAAVEQHSLVRSLTLVEPACMSLTAELPATHAYRELLEPLYARRAEMADVEFAVAYARMASASGEVQSGPGTTAPGALNNESAARAARRLRLQAPPWEAPLHIVPGVPTLVLTGGWEPLYEEIAHYLAGTGAVHRTTAGGHRPHDTAEGAALIKDFITAHSG